VLTSGSDESDSMTSKGISTSADSILDCELTGARLKPGEWIPPLTYPNEISHSHGLSGIRVITFKLCRTKPQSPFFNLFPAWIFRFQLFARLNDFDSFTLEPYRIKKMKLIESTSFDIECLIEAGPLFLENRLISIPEVKSV
jgi:hypothetical protein